MSGDDFKSKKLMAMNISQSLLTDVRYRFVRHGVTKYFSEIHKKIARLNALGAAKPDWELFSTILNHMDQHCIEYQRVVADIRKELISDESKVTLRSIERAFLDAETVNNIGTDNKGTPIARPVKLKPPPAASQHKHQRGQGGF